MSETKHTPGKWVLEYSTYDVNGVNWEVEGADGAHVAQNNFGGNDRETELANARLIAKAPELLELLEETVDRCRGYISCSKVCEGCESHYNADGICRIPLWEQLIAEAKGEPIE